MVAPPRSTRGTALALPKPEPASGKMYFTQHAGILHPVQRGLSDFPQGRARARAIEMAVPYFIDNLQAGAGVQRPLIHAGPLRPLRAPPRARRRPSSAATCSARACRPCLRGASAPQEGLPALSAPSRTRKPQAVPGRGAAHRGLHSSTLRRAARGRAGGCYADTIYRRKQQHGRLAPEGLPVRADGLHAPIENDGFDKSEPISLAASLGGDMLKK
jgi:hypothetical protein